jgi:hypothetical protein
MSALFGFLGRSFGRLGGSVANGVPGGGGGAYTPSLQFNDARNSQYLALLEEI